MSALTDILARFENPKPSGGQYLVRCSAHEDRSPSLAIREADDGSVLLKCHAGCSVDSILASLNLEPAALFPPKVNGSQPAKRDIVATYDYVDEDGKLLFQAVRYSPKGFSQRAPDGAGWKFSLAGVRRVLYHLPKLKGHPAILLCEGEKDVDAAWKLGIPATCNPMGAGKWTDDYAKQLDAQGVKRIAIVPDNDEPGRLHAEQVAKSCIKLGLLVRIATLPDVPDKGDLSDYLAKHTKEDLLALVREAPNWDPRAGQAVVDREFVAHGDSRYSLTVHSSGVKIDIDRMRRDRDGLTGELAVSVNGLFPMAKHHHGVISIGDFNCASVQARSTRAKLLAERSGDKDTDWFGLLEEFVTDVMAAEREGDPSVGLCEIDLGDQDKPEEWEVEGLPLLADLPFVLFGDAAAAKSYVALWLAGTLAGRGIPVLYLDWEFSGAEHRKRLEKLFQPPPSQALMRYRRCERPLIRIIDGVLAEIRKWGIRYVVCDSIGFALEGSPLDAEAATRYFAAVRRFNCGSLHLAHIAKHQEEGKDATIFGSNFFRAGARSAWYIERTTENADNEVRVGLYQRKLNSGPQAKAPLGFQFEFSKTRTTVSPIDIETVDELSVQLPMVRRVIKALSEADAPMSVKKLAEELASTPNIIRNVLSRHKSKFLRVGEKVTLAGPKDGEMQF